ncbi:acyltransferase family protein [Pontibacter silvestris]|uniref:Acyltransferase family protein n=1 Tax=Pontibacter silvestris TaxID=2305183 RepID=A0ABW4WX47_9BACT|nr:heparan-alpha-glucosaminide N-acetyltransferase domain-containing protein [Pontibacter silvestris]MCC9136754.1 heparan-alpha-glucosaminide N-acetyltransferase domain-containing protein [Pontibacter silvestris]
MNKLITVQGTAVTGLLKAKTSERYQALDVLRGLTIALMVVVNTPGSWDNIYAPFRHAAWHGFTLTDLVFPSFLFVVGNAMSFSMRKFNAQPDSLFLKKVFKRTALIFLIGLFLNLFPFVIRTDEGQVILKDFTAVRVMGVLQRIALCYFIASLAVRYLKSAGALIFSFVTLLAYWAILYFFGDSQAPYSLTGNAALKFDRWLLPEQNLYKGFGIPFDPEGLLSTLPAVVNVIAGYFAGMFIQKNGSGLGTFSKLNAIGAVLIVAAFVWDLYFPINKPLWTSSYVLHAVGLSLIILGTLLFIIKVAGFVRWAYFFEVFGKNPLFIFALATLLIKILGFVQMNGVSLQGWIYENLFLSWSEGKIASLLFALSYMLVMWLVSFWMDKRKIYIKV